MPSDARSTIELLIEAVEEKKRTNRDDKLRLLLWEEEGFRERRLAANFNHTVVHCLVRRRYETAEEVDEWLSYFFLEKNQSVRDPHPDEIYKRSPLHCAAWFGDLVCVKWLVEHGALLNTSDTFGERPLMAACASLIDAPLKVRYLAEAGADYLAQGPNGVMALCCAVSLDQQQAV
ncbi:death-associated protein kinase 1-like [Oscarella lobularis]|uniref:death-associated protein kinase 1-like n=1 Tax=Oscarella lobularis TaxID=121494 RepID=UPI0033137632